MGAPRKHVCLLQLFVDQMLAEEVGTPRKHVCLLQLFVDPMLAEEVGTPRKHVCLLQLFVDQMLTWSEWELLENTSVSSSCLLTRY